MTITSTRNYEPRRFEPGQLADCFEKMLTVLGVQKDDAEILAKYHHGEGTEEHRDLTPDDLGVICEIKDQPASISFRFHVQGEYGKDTSIRLARNSSYSFSEYLYIHWDYYDVKIGNKLVSILEESLSLKPFEAPEPDNSEASERDKAWREAWEKFFDRINDIETRLSTLETSLSARQEELTCFLSYRFNVRSKPLALELTRFLELLNIKVISGAGYEPRRVQDKVMARLEQPHDLFISLITADGESAWTRDELGVALGRGHAVILLVEREAQLGEGILGSWERIEFEQDHIGDAFIGIMEAIRFVREERLRQMVETGKEPEIQQN
uniref:TIR domain-containing protein n=1 Tax=Candidatus Kentrum sp. FW TaxID=2126338 RepID=A0A450TRU0_9GAMM|nr:MAG: hypothetical protein BECKFW1821C_GA0114237_102549 [Candidatus Kentron sp. FW]